ncbi:MAG TPA: hypothetical protein VK014_10680 [Cyclobacteriaceae bacterium]|nr:hypothetical protein [Cyclobacteriaceae bacterium]
MYNEKFFQFVQDHLKEDPALLLLKHKPPADFDLKEAVQQVMARQKVASKLPEWVAHPEVLFPATLSLEQSSSELTAKYKAKLVEGETLIDLTGGLGVDTFYMGQKFKTAVYLERQEKLVKLAQYNFALLHHESGVFHCLHGDAIAHLQADQMKYDWLFVDPARRGTDNAKLYKLADCEPDIVQHWHLMQQRAKNILIKASPMLDIKAALEELPGVNKAFVVAVKNEVKEVLLMRTQAESEVEVVALDLQDEGEKTFAFTFEQEKTAEIRYAMPATYLVEPNAAVLKAGAFKKFAHAYNLSKLHPNTHLYTSSLLPQPLCGRVFEVIQEVKLDKKELRRHFPSRTVNVLVRNHPLKPDILKKKYYLKDGGEDFLLATTTLDDKARAYWCRRIY